MRGERRIVFRKAATEKLHGNLLQGWRFSKKEYNNQYPITNFYHQISSYFEHLNNAVSLNKRNLLTNYNNMSHGKSVGIKY